MVATLEKRMEHIGETCGCADHDHDLVHVLSKRLDSVWRYDQYIANADGNPELQDFWRELKKQDVATVRRLKEFIADEIQKNCF